MSRPYTTGRYSISGDSGEWIPVNPTIGLERDPNVQPAEAMRVDSRDMRKTESVYNPGTGELVFACYRNHLERDEVTAGVRDARSRGVLKAVVAYLCPESYREQLFWLDKNQFVRDISREKSAYICVVRDLTKKVKQPEPKVEPAPAPAEPAPLTVEEIRRQAAELDQKIAKELATRANARTPTAMLSRLSKESRTFDK